MKPTVLDWIQLGLTAIVVGWGVYQTFWCTRVEKDLERLRTALGEAI